MYGARLRKTPSTDLRLCEGMALSTSRSISPASPATPGLVQDVRAALQFGGQVVPIGTEVVQVRPRLPQQGGIIGPLQTCQSESQIPRPHGQTNPIFG